VRLSRAWKAGIALSLVAGILLRVLYIEDMEYKEDERLFFEGSQRGDWPWTGMPTGVYILNPGMTQWIFKVLALATGARDPISLVHAVQAFALLGSAMILPFALRVIRDPAEREPWLWAFVLGMVNPLNVVYQRKLWPFACQLPLTMLIVIGWMKRSSFGWAFVWGLAGALIGQIHMSGFFLAGGVVLWTLLFGRRFTEATNWKGWFAGSVLGALPLIPWAMIVMNQRIEHTISGGWSNRLEAKYWVFWLTNPLGLHVGNTVGLLRGNAHLEQLSDFARYPLVGGSPTYLVGLAHGLMAFLALWALGTAVVRTLLRLKRGTLVTAFLGNFVDGSRTSFLIGASGIASGALLTATAVNIRRYYAYVSFPLDHVFLARLALKGPRIGPITPQRMLVLLWFCQLLVSASFVGYIHLNQGATQGDYGPAFSRIMSNEPTKESK
jgi:hypothetical protein